jgi:hypothetical protein
VLHKSGDVFLARVDLLLNQVLLEVFVTHKAVAIHIECSENAKSARISDIGRILNLDQQVA